MEWTIKWSIVRCTHTRSQLTISHGKPLGIRRITDDWHLMPAYLLTWHHLFLLFLGPPLCHSIRQLSSNFFKSGFTMDPVYRSSENPFLKRDQYSIDWAHVKTREMFNDWCGPPSSVSLWLSPRHLYPWRHHAIRGTRARLRGELGSPALNMGPSLSTSHQAMKKQRVRIWYTRWWFSLIAISDSTAFAHWKNSENHIMSVTGIEEEVEYASCDCCGLTEECTPAYISLVRSRYCDIYLII
jgi:Protein of unknown function (DUF1677)